MKAVKFIKDVNEIGQLSAEERARLSQVQEQYAFLATDYYLGLIDWTNSADPLRRIVVPCEAETEDWGHEDPSDEFSHTVLPGVQHKYADTAVLLASEVCGGQCRFCFRKRIFGAENREARLHLPSALHYLRQHPEVTSVLVTGGDALMLSTSRLARILEGLDAIPHVRAIRLGSKLPAYMPQRIVEDAELVALLSRYSRPDRRLYLMSHFNHPRELTELARGAVERLVRAGVLICNQTPVLCGVNDDVQVLADLLTELVACGATPYYFFQCRPTRGNLPYVVPITRCYFLVEEAKYRVSGLARRVRYTMSHQRGKVEVVGVTHSHIYVRYHRAKEPAREGRFLVFHRDDEACWYDDLLAQHRGRSVITTGAWQPADESRMLHLLSNLE